MPGKTAQTDLDRPADASSGGAQDGSFQKPRFYKPRALLFTILSVLWVFPSLGALAIIGWDFLDWLRASSVAQALQSIRLEHWMALSLLALHPTFIWLAMRYRRCEVPRPAGAPEIDPEQDRGAR